MCWLGYVCCFVAVRFRHKIAGYLCAIYHFFAEDNVLNYFSLCRSESLVDGPMTHRTWSWEAQMQWYLEQPLKEPVPYHGHALRDYKNDIVHIIQIGLGTYGTFMDTEYWMDVLLKASSRQPGDS